MIVGFNTLRLVLPLAVIAAYNACLESETSVGKENLKALSDVRTL